MRHVALFGYLLSVFSSQYLWVTFSPVETRVGELMGVSPTAVGYLAALFPALYLPLSLPSGLLLDRNLGLWLRLGAAAVAFGGVGRLIYPQSYPWLFACQLAAALGQPFLLNGFVAFASALYGKSRAAVVSALSLAMYLGIIAALGAGAELYELGGLEALMLPGAVTAGLGALMLAPLRAGRAGEALRLRPVVGRGDLWLLGMVLGMGMAIFNSLATWLEPALDAAGQGDMAGPSLALAMVAGLAGAALLPPRVSRANARKRYLLTAALAGVGAFLAAAASVQPLLLVLVGFVMLPGYPVIMDWIGAFVPGELHGSATGLVNFIYNIPTVLLVFAASSFAYSAQAFFAFLAACSAAAAVLVLLLPDDRRRYAPSSQRQAGTAP